MAVYFEKLLVNSRDVEEDTRFLKKMRRKIRMIWFRMNAN